jgi:hypothetical protein
MEQIVRPDVEVMTPYEMDIYYNGKIYLIEQLTDGRWEMKRNKEVIYTGASPQDCCDFLTANR